MSVLSWVASVSCRVSSWVRCDVDHALQLIGKWRIDQPRGPEVLQVFDGHRALQHDETGSTRSIDSNGLVMLCTRAIPGVWKTVLAILSRMKRRNKTNQDSLCLVVTVGG